MELRDIKKHWEEAGQRFLADSKVTPTSRDPYLGELERENILGHLQQSYSALEVGCGDATHTIHYAKRVKNLSAVDVAESLINIARSRAAAEEIKNIDFASGSVLDIASMYPPQSFDCIISQRCLINLPDWQYQQEAILQVHRLLKGNGTFIMSEGFAQELESLNQIRKRVGLAEIAVVPYNRNIQREDFEEFVSSYFDIAEVRWYGFYLFLSRVLHPLYVLPDEPKHDSPLNARAMELSRVVYTSDFNKYSYNIFYLLRKK